MRKQNYIDISLFRTNLSHSIAIPCAGDANDQAYTKMHLQVKSWKAEHLLIDKMRELIKGR